jgi:Brp/Blh family beta-carotene 15,15'-monooxygenase
MPSFFMTKYLQYGLALVVGSLYLVFIPEDDVTNIVALTAILFFGVPHGAIDHKIHLKFSKKSNVRKFILIYVLVGLGFLLWWVLMPLKALLIFIILSAYHFGQELIEDIAETPKDPILNLSWGLIVLVSPIILKFNELLPTLNFIGSQPISRVPKDLQLITVLVIHLLGYAYIAYLLVKGIIRKAAAIRLILFSIYLLLSYIMLPFIVAFALYFVLFHSINAMRHQFFWMKDRSANYTFMTFLKDLSPFTLLTIVGMSGLIYYLNPDDWSVFFTYFFVFISMLTLPHAILFDELYVSKNTTYQTKK